MRITIVSGARPNFMKIAPICRAIDAAREAGKNISYRIVYTGPQDDTSLDASLFSDLSMRKPDAYLGVTGHNHSQVAASIMLAFERELDGHPAQVVLVVDDMTATMSCSIVAKKRGLKVAHVIAGTRSFDMNMPREVNRTIVDAISDYLFTAGMVANRNLNQEGMIPEHPKLCVRHGDSWYLDPGQPGTADYLASLCREIAANYDVDGIHFDYIRYPENAVKFNDAASYRKYGKRQNKADWRRSNMTRCVRAMYRAVKAAKPWVKVSSSPVGKFSDLSRYPSYNWNAYSAVHQDAQGWLREGIQDMLFPMMYFRGNHFYPFAIDWKENDYGRPVVPGLGIYFLSPEEKDWPLEDITRELYFTRSLDLGGQAFFRYAYLNDNHKGLFDFLKDVYYPFRPCHRLVTAWTVSRRNVRKICTKAGKRKRMCSDGRRLSITDAEKM